MIGIKDFKKGDVVEFAHNGNFVKYKGRDNNFLYDIGTVIQNTPSVKVLWKSDNETTEPLLETIRLLKDEVREVTKSPEEYYLCMTKEEVEIFMDSLSTYDDEYYCSKYDNARSVIEDIIAFKNKAKENQEDIQKALELLSKFGYSCTKN